MSDYHWVSGQQLANYVQAKADITVETIAQRDDIQVWRRKWKMVVGVYNDGVDTAFYSLEYNLNSTDLSDNLNWVAMNVSEESDPIFSSWLENNALHLTIAELNAWDKDPLTFVYIKDGLKYGLFRHDTSSSETDDGIMWLHDNNGEVYQRVDSVIRPRYFGAVGDAQFDPVTQLVSGTDDTSALDDFFDYVDRGVLELDGKNYRVNGVVTIHNKNILSGNQATDNGTPSSLTINGNGARFITDGASVDNVLKITSCKRIHINKLQVDGVVSITGLWESKINECYFKTLKFGFETLASADTSYNNYLSGCFFGMIDINIGDAPNNSLFNQNMFAACKIGYGIRDDSVESIRLFGAGDGQGITFNACDIYPPADKKVLYIDETVNDVTIILSGGTYIDTGTGLPLDLKNVHIINTGLIVATNDDIDFDYMLLKNASRTPMRVTSFPTKGSRIASSNTNLITAGNILTDIPETGGFTTTYNTGGIHGRYANFVAATAQSVEFVSIEAPMTGYYTASVIGRLNDGSIGSVWSHDRSGSFVEIQYGVIKIGSSQPTWDAVTVYLEAGDKFKLRLFSAAGGADFDVYDASLVLGFEGSLYAPVMHPSLDIFDFSTVPLHESLTYESEQFKVVYSPLLKTFSSVASLGDFDDAKQDGNVSYHESNWDETLLTPVPRPDNAPKLTTTGYGSLVSGSVADYDAHFQMWFENNPTQGNAHFRVGFNNTWGSWYKLLRSPLEEDLDFNGFQVKDTGNISVDVDDTYNIGSSTKKYKDIHGRKIIIPDGTTDGTGGELIIGYTPDIKWIGRELSDKLLFSYKATGAAIEPRAVEFHEEGQVVARNLNTESVFDTVRTYTIDISKNQMHNIDIDLRGFIDEDEIGITLTLPPQEDTGTVCRVQLNVIEDTVVTGKTVNLTWKYGSGAYNVVSSCWENDTPLSSVTGSPTTEDGIRYNLTFQCFGKNMYDMAVNWFERPYEAPTAGNPGFDD
jgi:hypothetical protein